MGQSPDSVPTPGDSSEPNLLSLAQDELALNLKKELEPGEYNIFLKLTVGWVSPPSWASWGASWPC